MTASADLKARVNDKVKAGVPFTKILQRDRAGKPVTLLTPGSEGKQYEVILRRYGAVGTVSTECRLMTPAGLLPCKGNINGVCYHSLMAVARAMKDAHGELSFCANEAAAKRVIRLRGGNIVRVTNKTATASLWVVATTAAN